MPVGACLRFCRTCVPLQTVPSPVNPCLQVQLYEPSLLAQSAFSSHGLVPKEHSSISKGDRRDVSRLSVEVFLTPVGKNTKVRFEKSKIIKSIFTHESIFEFDAMKRQPGFYLDKSFHFQYIPVRKYSCRNRQCWYIQRFRHMDWVPGNTHQNLMQWKGQLVAYYSFFPLNLYRNLHTFTSSAISIKSLLAATGVRTCGVGTISVHVTRTGIGCALIDI